MSLSTSLADLYRRLKYSSIPSADVTTRLTSGLNKAQQAVLGEIGGGRLTHGTITFDSLANQAEYGLPPSIARVLSIRDTANNRRLQDMPESAYRTMLPNTATSTGTPYAYSLLGIGFVAVKCSASVPIVAVSDSALDITQTISINAVQSTGQTFTPDVAGGSSAVLTGTSAVSLTSAGTVEVTDAYLSAVAVGMVTIRETNAAGAILSTIYKGHLRETYQRIALIATPASALTYTVDYERDAFDLISATDSFPVPVRFADCVIERALMYEYADAGDVNRYGIASKEYNRLLGLLNDYLVNPPDRVYVPGRRMGGPSNLPANFPTSGFGWP